MEYPTKAEEEQRQKAREEAIAARLADIRAARERREAEKETVSYTVSDPEIFRRALSCLKQAYGEDAVFREGQYEAIEATLTKKRTLVVQRTGWGKSLVYFIVTKLIREKSRGVTIVVSPLLALMENQQEAAEKLGLKCASLNSNTRDHREQILAGIINGELDLVLVTPETMFSNDVRAALPQINIGLFVVDEAHCISDWGHDFRLEYCRLRQIIKTMDADVPILATTATANDRVIADLKEQFGNNVYISRGSLMRNNLAIQVINLPRRGARYAWLLENIPKLQGTGIVYCLTQRDCENLAIFLSENGIEALSYYSRDGEADLINQEALEKFMNNDIKVLVSTVKLGMGFDKGDVSFIVHFQMPANVVTYYQQIGRAGRNIPRAYTFLLVGEEDIDIHDYFIRKAFPEEHEMREVLSIIDRADDGIGERKIDTGINISNSRLKKTLAFLINEGYIFKEGSKFYSVGKPFEYRADYYEEIRRIRRKEIDQMFDLVSTRECYNRYIINLLNDDSPESCGCCSNCCGEILPSVPGKEASAAAEEYLKGLKLEIIPRKRWPATKTDSAKNITIPNQPGICLSRYGDPGYGELVKAGKYPEPTEFAYELVEKGAEVLYNDVIKKNDVRYITCVPSLRSDIVERYTKQLAEKTGLEYLDILGKKNAEQQKHMENSYYQYMNAIQSFYVKPGMTSPEKIILVDDIVDSKWTLTVCGHLLCQCGSSWVFPFALAESSRRDDM